MAQARQIVKRLGISGIAFLILLILYFVFYFTDHTGLFLIDFCVMIPLGLFVSIRFFLRVQNRVLWSLRNRLLFVYGLIGVLPVVLLLSMALLTGWALVSELAIYLANSELERRVFAVQSSIQIIRRIPPEELEARIPEVQKGFSSFLSGIELDVKDPHGDHRFPSGGPPLNVPAKWGNLDGLLVYHKHFCVWAHYRDSTEEITALAPLSNEMIENLVPHLGVIGLVEEQHHNEEGASAGAIDVSDDPKSSDPSERARNKIPDPVNRFDIPVVLASEVSHSHLDNPGSSYRSLLYVHSRVSAVLRAFFSDPDILRGALADVLIGIAILFLLVEVVAVVIGVSLSRRITAGVNQLYEGTRRVIRGDFTHRISVKTHDQLGDLGESFNQMTGNLQRLLDVEKERERLQAELEIAREVQAQLYPPHQPPRCGLKLIARCDPARMVSGDYYDYQSLGKTKCAFAIGDVAGKGISAALLMATIQASLRAQISGILPMNENECTLEPQVDAAVLVSRLNKQVYANTSPEKYATFFFSVFDEKTQTLTYTNAGHLSPLLFREKEVIPLDSNGTVVGAFPFSKYDESCVVVNPGDLLVCYTDGITEPENAYGEMFGEERLIELVKKYQHSEEQEIIRVVFDAVRSWTGSPELHDDMTLLLARQVGEAVA